MGSAYQYLLASRPFDNFEGYLQVIKPLNVKYVSYFCFPDTKGVKVADNQRQIYELYEENIEGLMK